jgi:hypothetical protein
MKHDEKWETIEKNKYQALLIGHGALVLLIGLISGVILLFAMLGGLVLWPILDIQIDFPGSVRGWKAAHVGGLTNGLLIAGVGLILTKFPLTMAKTRFIFWSFVLTGWGNTLFYWGGNLSGTRGLSIQDNAYGESNIAGVIAFIGGGSAMIFTIIATAFIGIAAFKYAKNKSY